MDLAFPVAVGCADLPSSQNSMSIRSGDGTTIWCNFTKDIYHLKCSGNTWVGDMPNCSTAGQQPTATFSCITIFTT